MLEHEMISSVVGRPANRALETEPLELPLQEAMLCGLVGGVLASAVGRERTRVDNAIIAGLFTGFASFRDPRVKFEHTLLIAAFEGVAWGLFDRAVPHIKARFFE
jgi:hypothetical protein